MNLIVFERDHRVMKLIEALEVLRKTAPDGAERFVASLVCGFTPLHLRTFLAAQLQLLYPFRRVKVDTGLYGDFFGNLSKLRELRPEAGIVVMEWQDLDPRLGIRSLGGWLPNAFPDILENVKAHATSIQSAIESISRELPISVCFPTLPLPPISYAPSWEASAFETQLRARVSTMAEKIHQLPNVKVVNPQQLDLLSPPGQRFDVDSELLTGFPYRLPHAAALAELLGRLVNSPAPKKGLITDLDDTIWNGILGEVGPEGVSWDLDHHSQMHGVYQQLLHALSAEGVLVAIASKNDPKLVDEVIRSRSPILPQQALFPIEVNWGPKSESVSRILRAWNVAADSVVFVDDSLMELAEVKTAYPEIECLRFPEGDNQAVYDLLRRLRDLFGKSAVREEDGIRLDSLRRAASLRQNQEFVEGSPEKFLEQAGAEITFTFDGKTLDPRALELINKTNQFNLNGRRHTQSALQSYLRDPGAFLLVVSYRDKYGPLGKIAVIAGRSLHRKLQIDTWVMSCRAFSRRIEHRCLEELIAKFDAEEVELDFSATPRNGPIQIFLTEILGGKPDSLCRLPASQFRAKRPKTYHQVQEIMNG